MAVSDAVALLMCLLAGAGHVIATTVFVEDAVCAVQVAMTGEDRSMVDHASARGLLPTRAALRKSLAEAASEGGGPKGGDTRQGKDGEISGPTKLRMAVPAASGPPDDCEGQVQMDLARTVVTNNLGGLGPTAGDPVIHIEKFIDLMNGRTVDLFVSNLTTYAPNNVLQNGLKGDFNNINIKAGSVDLLFTFKDTETQVPEAMPAFNMTIYDFDGPKKDVYAESVAIDTADFTSYKVTDSTDVTIAQEAGRTVFGSSAHGEGCDNPTSIETLGVVVCPKSGTVDQKDRSVALQMKGGRSSYHITLTASKKARGRNFLFGIPSRFDKVCHSPTQSPTLAPTAAPTGSPTYSPTSSPTGSPTSSPSSSPTASPTGFPTSSPSSSPTSSPTGSPTTSPSYSPTSSPTGSPTSSPTLTPSYSPTSSPTGSPTNSPTSSPTLHTVATSFGDPHVTNLKGERFDILQTDYHNFLVIPRGADAEHALLHVVAKVDPLGQLCSGLLYVTSLRFTGRWVGDVGSLEFTTSVRAPMEAEKAMQIKAGASSCLNASQFGATVPQSLAEVTEFQPQQPQSLNQHVDLLLVKLKLGPSIAKVRMVYQKEKFGFSNSLWLTTTGLGQVQHAIGGILGVDDHTFAASKPKQCAASALLGLPTPHGSVHASASLENDDQV